MELRLCPLWKKRENERRFSQRGCNVVFCRNCELFFIHPYPERVDHVHNRVSDDDFQEIEILDTERHYRSEVQFQKRYFTLIDQEVKGGASILDVGCGTGHLLERLSIYRSILFR